MNIRRSIRISNLIRLLFFPTILLLTILAGFRVNNYIHESIMHGFDRKLSAISTTAGAFVNLEEHEEIFQARDHESPLYLKYVHPLRKLRVDQQLTYLYSFVLHPENGSISYVLDGSVDEDFTHIGYIDNDLPSEDFEEASIVLRSGRPYISDIKPWGQWGLIKVGFGPIFDSEFRAGAIMGADLNVSAISQVSREALVILSLSSFFFLIISGFAAWYISRPLIAPLLKLRDELLHISAGFFDKPIDNPSLKDLQPLAQLFNEVGEKLNLEINESSSSKLEFENHRRLHDLMVMFQAHSEGFSDNRLTCRFLEKQPDSPGYIGAVLENECAVVWQLAQEDHSLERFRRHQELLLYTKNLLQSGISPSQLGTYLKRDLHDIVTGFLIWDGNKEILANHMKSVQELLLYTDSQTQRREIQNEEQIYLGTGQCNGWKLSLSEPGSGPVLELEHRTEEQDET